jgi:hypothetical protein
VPGGAGAPVECLLDIPLGVGVPIAAKLQADFLEERLIFRQRSALPGSCAQNPLTRSTISMLAPAMPGIYGSCSPLRVSKSKKNKLL